MDIISWIVIGIVVLFGILGYARGFINILLGILKSLSSFVISFFLAKPFGNLLYNVGLGNVISRELEKNIFSGKEIFDIVINSENKELVIKKALETVSIPEFLHDIIYRIGDNLIGEIETQTVGQFISSSAANLCCIIIGFIVLMLCSGIIFFLLRKVLKQIKKVRFIRRVDRILGLVVNACFALLLISLVFFGIATITTVIPSFNETITELLNLNSNEFSIAKWLYENNLIIKLFELFVK